MTDSATSTRGRSAPPDDDRPRRQGGGEPDAATNHTRTKPSVGLGVGLAIAAPSAADHFVAALLRSLAEPLIATGLGLYTRMTSDAAAEEEILRHWALADGIVGAAVLGAGRDDPRVALLRSLGLPFAVVAEADDTDECPGVVIDVAAGTDTVGAYLDRGRHRRTVYVSDPTPSAFRRSRAATIATRFEAAASDGSVSSAVSVALAAIESGPATLLFDSDVHAAAALAALTERGLSVPEDAAVVSWTDSSLCQSTTPSITAVNRRGRDIGTLLGAQLLAAIDGRPATPVTAPHPFVVTRESS